MNFAVFNNTTKDPRELTDVLLALFPGSVIYEYVNAPALLEGLHGHGFDAVFLRISDRDELCLRLLGQIRDFDASTKLIICADSDLMLEDAMWNGVSAFLIEPLNREMILDAMGMGEGGEC